MIYIYILIQVTVLEFFTARSNNRSDNVDAIDKN